MSESDRDILHSAFNAKVYHLDDGDGNPVCNNAHLGGENSSHVQTTESEVDRMFLCEKCEQKVGDYRKMPEIINNIRGLCNLTKDDKPESYLTREECIEVERQLGR